MSTLTPMEVGEVRVACDSDFVSFRNICSETEGWKSSYHKHGLDVWTKKNDKSEFRLIKLCANYPDVPAAVLYDVLHDPQFRKVWDDYCLESQEFCCLNPNNDIGYYALRCPKPIRGRDFVMLRSWLETGNEYFIVSHSVNHQDLPPRRGLVRGIAYSVGYYIKVTGDRSCQLYYISQLDPKGRLPSWTVNKATSFFAPKLFKKLYKACLLYDTWKLKQPNPKLKPWLFPEQMTLPRLDWSKVESMDSLFKAESIDETRIEAPTDTVDSDADSVASDDSFDLNGAANSKLNHNGGGTEKTPSKLISSGTGIGTSSSPSANVNGDSSTAVTSTSKSAPPAAAAAQSVAARNTSSK